ncbi:MAG: 4-hydroxythreonine-4-phosphate dehydrogenase PdxA [Candidatus Omnitrophota bacterium]|jgi:4-hydroxythreonine-4-phosphate dehydrogenase
MAPSIIAVTMGDPGGIGPEVIAKALRKIRPSGRFRFVIFGTPQVFKQLKTRLKLGLRLKPVTEADFTALKPGDVGLVDISYRAKAILEVAGVPAAEAANLPYKIGSLSKVNAAMTLAALERAAACAMGGQVCAIATAPLNKEALRLLDPHFKGHTEYLAQAAGAKEVAMTFVSPRLHVTLVTIHVALRNVSGLLTPELIESKILLTDAFHKKYFKKARPRIAVCALNPHGRETGDEEERVIVPAIESAKRRGVLALGPFPSDALFYHAWHGEYDAVVSMYHDQGLGPFKMMAFHDGVNVTAGLPFVRTSPDHGTAFDIAWKGKANPASMTNSIRLACRFSSAR